MMPTVQRLSNDVSVAPQLTAAAMAEAASAGFRSVINNRPDFEGGIDQPTNDSIARAAEAAGLAYAYQPVSGSLQTPEDIARFAELLDTLPKPLLAFCRTGTRCTRLFQAATSS